MHACILSLETHTHTHTHTHVEACILLLDTHTHTGSQGRHIPWQTQPWFQNETYDTQAYDPNSDSTLIHSNFNEADPRLIDDRRQMTLKITFLPLTPWCFLCTGKDGLIVMYDLRTSSSEGRRQLVLDLSQLGATTDLVFNPCSPHVFAVGSEDTYVRLFDMRSNLRSGV
jgi:WD40 repeat protein